MRGTYSSDKTHYGIDEEKEYHKKKTIENQMKMRERMHYINPGHDKEHQALIDNWIRYKQQEYSKMQSKGLDDLRKFFKAYDGKEDVEISVNRDKSMEGQITISIDNNRILNRQLTSFIQIAVGTKTQVLPYKINDNYYILHTCGYSTRHDLMGHHGAAWETPEDEWHVEFQRRVQFHGDRYHSIKILRRDLAETEVLPAKIAQEEIEFSQFEIPQKKRQTF